MVLNFSLNKKFTDSDNILHITLLVLCLDYFYINHQLILINYAIHIFNWNFKMSGIGRSVNVTYWWHEMKKKKNWTKIYGQVCSLNHWIWPQKSLSSRTTWIKFHPTISKILFRSLNASHSQNLRQFLESEKMCGSILSITNTESRNQLSTEIRLL